MDAVRPLEATVSPRALAFFPSFAQDLLPAFEGMERLSAKATNEGLIISGVWEPDLDIAASLIGDKFAGDVLWSKPSVRYIREPRLLEPILRIEVRALSDYLGNVIGDLLSRRGILLAHTETPEGFVASADVPLAELFGYRTSLRALTHGSGEATANFIRYELAPGWRGPDPDEPMSAALRA